MSARLRVHDGTFRYPGAPTPILERIEVEVDDGELLVAGKFHPVDRIG